MNKFPIKFAFTRAAVLAIALMSGGLGANAQSLHEVLAEVYVTNPDLLLNRAQLRSVNEGLAQALSNYNPDLRIISNAGKRTRKFNTRGFNSISNSLDTASVVLNASQSLYNGGSTIASVKQADHQINAARNQLRNVENITLSQAAVTYWDVVLAKVVINLNERNVNRLEQSLDATEDRFEFGEVTLTDVAQAKSRLARSQSDLTNAQGNFAIARALYLSIVGQESGELSTPEELQMGVHSRDEAIMIAVENNPAAQQLQDEIQSAQQEIKRQLGDLRPNLDLQVSASVSRESQGRNQSIRQADVLGVLTIPLYQRGFEASQVRQARENLQATKLRYEQTIRQIKNNTAQVWAQIESARAESISSSKEVDSTNIALEGVREESRVGSRTVLDLLDAEQENLDALVRNEQARRNLETAKIQLHALLGRYEAKVLDLPVAIHDTSKHYNQVRAKVNLINLFELPDFDLPKLELPDFMK